MQTVDKSHKRYRCRGTEAFSPTLYQLEQFMQIAGMKRTRWSWRARFSERNLDFSPDACESLEYKHLLAQLMTQYCPEMVPETYILNDYSWIV
jgi:tubulin--tyrosine ligase